LPRSAPLDRKLASGERALALACLLAGGDDYELCFTAPPAQRAAVAGIAHELGLPLTRIGDTTTGSDLVVLDERSVPLAALPRAFDHFATT
jgi:thiamine-monophosphate kinase